MKVSSRIDGSICGAILLPRPSSNQSAAAAAAAVRRILPYNHGRAINARSFCVGSAASRVPRPLLKLPSLRRAHVHNNSFFRPSASICENHTAAAAVDTEPGINAHQLTRQPDEPPQRLLSQQEALALVDPYGGEEVGCVDDHLQFARDPYMRGYATPDGPHISFVRNQDDVDYPSPEEATQPNDEERKILWDLRFAILTRLRNRDQVDLDTIYEVYQQLPGSRISYIPGRLRHQLLKTLAQPDKKNSKSMLRYFAVIADVKNNGFTLTHSEWNSAISFASRYVGVSTEAETDAALKLWREMEVDAGIKGTDVTFNILFDVASKAGNFTLAEMIYKEMESRGHWYNRYHHVSLIHFFGLKNDTAGMRAAYQEMVRAGEMIDTVALNAMISGLLRSCEEGAAERIYERMKASVSHSTPLPTRTYSSNKAITQALQMFAKLGRRHPRLRRSFQKMALIHPDLSTFVILINHHGVRAGNLTKVAQYIDEMKVYQIPLHGSVFLALFKGFALHGGSSQSAWSPQRLGSIWSAFLDAMDGGVVGLEIKTWLAMWILRAFYTCSKNENSVLDAYGALKARWQLDAADQQFMADFLANLLRRKR